MKNNLGNKGWIDVTATVQSGMVHWPGELTVEIEKKSSIEDGDDANVTALSLSAHTGTHIDAPLHFIAKAKDVTQLSLEKLIGLAKVFSIRDTKKITADELRTFDIEPGDRILFKTNNSSKDWAALPFLENYVYMDETAASYLRDKGVFCVGVDYLSVAEKGRGAEVHHILLEKEILIIEGLYLQNVEPGSYEMLCLPLKIQDADGAPARVLLKSIGKNE